MQIWLGELLILSSAEVFLLQELVDLKRPLNETKAGKALYTDKQKLLADRDTVRSLAEQAREDSSNLQLTQKLEAELKHVQKCFDGTFNEAKELEIHRRLSAAAYRRWQGCLAKPAMTDDLSPDNIIIACVISLSYFFIFSIFYVASWAQLVLGKALYVPSVYFAKGYFCLTSAMIVHKHYHRV